MLKQFKNIIIGETFRGFKSRRTNIYEKISPDKYQLIFTPFDLLLDYSFYIYPINPEEEVEVFNGNLDELKAEAL